MTFSPDYFAARERGRVYAYILGGEIGGTAVVADVTNDAAVEDVTGVPIPGLFAAGEIVGGLYYHNYASGTGLMAGSVFGRIAGRSAAGYVRG